MTTDQVLFGVGLIVVLAVGSQLVASQLRIPALIILLPAGFVAGAATSDVSPQHLLGPAFQPLVSLAVVVILYDSGLGLTWGTVTGRARRVVPRLVWMGVPVTFAFTALLAGPLLGMSRRLRATHDDGSSPFFDTHLEWPVRDFVPCPAWAPCRRTKLCSDGST